MEVCPTDGEQSSVISVLYNLNGHKSHGLTYLINVFEAFIIISFMMNPFIQCRFPVSALIEETLIMVWVVIS